MECWHYKNQIKYKGTQEVLITVLVCNGVHNHTNFVLKTGYAFIKGPEAHIPDYLWAITVFWFATLCFLVCAYQQFTGSIAFVFRTEGLKLEAMNSSETLVIYNKKVTIEIFTVVNAQFSFCVTERRARVVTTPASYSGGAGLKCRPQRPAMLTDLFPGFHHYLQANAGIVPYIRPRPLPTKSFPIHLHSLITILSTLYSLVTEKKRRKINYQPSCSRHVFRFPGHQYAT
jgi:hypothetical protein